LSVLKPTFYFIKILKKDLKILAFYIRVMYNYECVAAMMCEVADTPG